MSFENECALLEARFASSWSTFSPIDWDNTDYKPVSGTSYVEFRVINGFSTQASTGASQLFRSDGVVHVKCMLEKSEGRKEADQFTDKAAGIFRGWRSSGLTCRAPYVTRIGELDGWYQLLVTVPYFRDEYFSI